MKSLEYTEWLTTARQRLLEEVRRIDEQLAAIGTPASMPDKTTPACLTVLANEKRAMTPTEVQAVLVLHPNHVGTTVQMVSTALSRIALAGGVDRPRHGAYQTKYPPSSEMKCE